MLRLMGLERDPRGPPGPSTLRPAVHAGTPGKITVIPFSERTINSYMSSSGKGLANSPTELSLYSLSFDLSDANPGLT